MVGVHFTCAPNDCVSAVSVMLYSKCLHTYVINAWNFYILYLLSINRWYHCLTVTAMWIYSTCIQVTLEAGPRLEAWSEMKQAQLLHVPSTTTLSTLFCRYIHIRVASHRAMYCCGEWCLAHLWNRQHVFKWMNVTLEHGSNVSKSLSAAMMRVYAL